MPVPPSAFPRPLHVALLAGGPSAEREVSLESGREIRAALERRGHRVTTVDPGAEPPSEADFLRLADWSRFDVALLALHGTFGEDGTIQRLLDSIGLPYTGSDARASQLAFSKSAAKERFAAEKLATPPYVLVHSSDTRARLAHHAASLGYPLVVKPDAQGSSLGVSIVHRPDDLSAALSHCFALGPFALLERFVPGHEWTVGFVGADPLPPMHVTTSRPFLDFEAKYRDEATTVRFDSDLPTHVLESIVSLASKAVRALGVTGVSRVDLRLDPALHPWLLEVNTLPGFTPHSAVPTAAARAGVPFDDLCERLLSLALAGRSLRRAA